MLRAFGAFEGLILGDEFWQVVDKFTIESLEGLIPPSLSH